MVGESIIESRRQLIELDDNELRGGDFRRGQWIDQSREGQGNWGTKTIQIQQQEVIRNKKRETSNWVLQNLIKLVKVLGVDF